MTRRVIIAAFACALGVLAVAPASGTLAATRLAHSDDAVRTGDAHSAGGVGAAVRAGSVVRAGGQGGLVRSGGAGGLVRSGSVVRARGASAASHDAARRPSAADAPPGTNLLLNPGAEAGAYSARGWDAVTIPGWQIVSGLPTVVRYGTHDFPAVTGRRPMVRGGQLFAGGAGGTARLRQVVSLGSGTGTRPSSAAAFRLSAWLGGSKTSSAAVSVTFLSAAGHVLGHAALGPAGGHRRAATIAFRSRGGRLPAGTARAAVVVTLATTLKNIDGPYAPYAGYDRGVADNIRFSVAAPARRAVLTAPAAHVPRYQHVFLFYFENEDFGSVVGNSRKAPFLNSLLPRGSLLARFFAEEHPSDGNYLALAGGSTFGIPLDDPLEENPRYTIRAPNIGDLVDAAGESWKAYLQSADGPCDDTVHGYYWDDDMPMTYFADVRDRPAYCAAHLVPLQALHTDLASAATTPAFSWVSPDDCADMEGCGIRAGDNFLRTELSAIMSSSAWRTQRSLAIITFDEDGYDHQRPAQRVATIMIGSTGVRKGYVSHVRYTHYSLLRTIEAALGLGSLTANDRYAQPVNDVFRPASAGPSAPAASAPAAGPPAAPASVARPPVSRASFARSSPAAGATVRQPVAASSPGARPPRQQTAFVVNSASSTVTPVDLVTRRADKPIRVGADPVAIALAPGGGTAYVVNAGSGTVTPIATRSREAGTPIRVGRDPQAIAISRDGLTAYVTNEGSDSVTPIDLRTGHAGTPIPVGSEPRGIAITPDGHTAFVLDWGGGSVTPISLVSGRAGRPIRVGSYPFAIAVAPNGSAAYVANYGSDSVTPIGLGTWRAGRPVPVGQAPNALAITPDSRTVLAVDGDSEAVTPLTTPRPGGGPGGGGPGSPGLAAGPPVKVGYSPTAVAITASGQTAFVVNTISGTLTPVALGTGRTGHPISVGLYSYPTGIQLAPAGELALVIDSYGDQVTLVNTKTRHAVRRVNVGSYPVAAVIAP